MARRFHRGPISEGDHFAHHGERYYCEAEQRLGVSGEPGPFPEVKRSEPYPMRPMPLSHNLRELKTWAEKSGIPFWGTPQAKNTVPYGGRQQCIRCNTCSICPTGARYSPDFTFKQLMERKKIALVNLNCLGLEQDATAGCNHHWIDH